MYQSTSKSDVVSTVTKCFVPNAYVLPVHGVIDGAFAIMPNDIPSDFEHLWSAFDNTKTEISAAYVMLLCKQNGSWAPFTYEQINSFYMARHKKQVLYFSFNRLIEPGWHYAMPGKGHLVGGGWIVVRDGLHYVTDDFINRVHKAATS